MIDVSSLVGDIPTVSVTVRTYGASTANEYGEAVESYSDASATVVAVPVEGRALQREGLDAKREPVVFTSTVAIGLSSAVRPARILYASRWYEVQRVKDYLALGGVLKIVGALVDEVAA